MKNLFTELALPADLCDERWLIIGADACDLADTITAYGAHLTCAPWNELAALSGQRFDVTVCQNLFEGVRHPLLALENVCALTTSYALLHAPLNALNNERAWLQWNETGWQTNLTALARMARSAGFAHVADVARTSVCDRSVDFSPRDDVMTGGLKSLLSQTEVCATLQAFRHWPVEPLALSLTIRRVFNPVTGLNVFPRFGRRAFLALIVAGLPSDARRWEVRVNVGGFGVQPIYVGPAEVKDCMQINVPMPPGLPLGLAAVEVWHRQACAIASVVEISEGQSW